MHGPMCILKDLWTSNIEEPEVKNSYQYVFELREKLEDTVGMFTVNYKRRNREESIYYDRDAKVREFKPGDKVFVLLPTDHNKLLMQWKGPYDVSEVVDLNDYKVKVKGKTKVYRVA